MEQRKNEHIELAFSSVMEQGLADKRFNYEPLLGSLQGNETGPMPFLGKTLKVPIWVSSMTGGSREAGTINRNLAKACREFGMGMGLGSCRILFDHPEHFDDFNLRHIIGDELPLYANIGIVQVEQMIENRSFGKLADLVQKLNADGLVIHVNPVQELIQEEGEVFRRPPVETIEEILSLLNTKIIVKEVGQGMGPESLRALVTLPVEAIEFAAFGGTNFAQVELTRSMNHDKRQFSPLARVGHSAGEMLETINAMFSRGETMACRQLIISGGIRSFLDGYYYISKSSLPAVYGQASGFLQHARGDYQDLQAYVATQVIGLKFAKSFLQIKR